METGRVIGAPAIIAYLPSWTVSNPWACIVRTVVYPTAADNSITSKTRYNAPSHHAGEGAISWFHTFFTTNLLCWPSYGSSSCCMLPSLSEGLRYHRQRRPSRPKVNDPTSRNP